jgi:DNA repair exonuclease SbcCD ATPase subunit
LHKLYSDEVCLFSNYQKWLLEFSSISDKYDSAKNESDALENTIRDLEQTLYRNTLEKQDYEQKLVLINQRKTEYQLYCSEKDRRTLEYRIRSSQLDHLWYSQLSLYHSLIAVLLSSVHSKQKRLLSQQKALVTEIESVKHAIAMHANADALKTVMDAYPLWIAWKTETDRLRSLHLLVRELETRSGNKMEGIDVSGIKSVMEVVVYLSDTFDGYREWLYKEHISPLIEHHVNSVLSLLCEDRPLYLHGEWLDKISTLSWFIRDGSSRPVIEKASGFQRFIVGMACRVAFHHIGFCRIQYDQLFLDEGFTSCDADNLERVPDFLRSLLQMYDSIYLATHLDDLKRCADSQIIIHRDALGLSQIHSGGSVVGSGSVGSVVTEKKKGRPSKKIAVVKVN